MEEAIDDLADYPWWHATRAELLNRLDRPAEAHAAYRHALTFDLSEPVAAHLRGRLRECGGS